MELEYYIVEENTSILDTLKKIDRNVKGIAYVVDSANVLLGAISDGDIRRYILKKQSINGVAHDVMNANIHYLENEFATKAVQCMKEAKITSIPIVDKEKHILSIIFSGEEKYYVQTDLDVPVVIMAGGKGTRLYPYTQILPKPLIPVGEKTIMEHIMDHFVRFGCDRFSVIVNHKKELIQAYFHECEKDYNLDFVVEKEFLGTAGGLKLLEKKVNETFFLSNCDILLEENYGEILKYHKNSKNVITLVCALKKEIIPYGTVITDEKGRIKKINEKPELEFLTNTGFYVIEPEFLKEIPKDTFIHITDVIQQCIDKGLSVGVYPVSEEAWMDMGQMKELEKMRNRLEGTRIDNF